MGAVAMGLYQVLNAVCFMVQMMILASVIVSFVGDPSNQIVQMIYRITEPMYRPIRRFTAKIPGPLDWSPLVLYLIVLFVQTTGGQLLMEMARGG